MFLFSLCIRPTLFVHFLACEVNVPDPLFRRYSFLAFGWNERVAPTRDNCRLFLLRLKMDGWALGKTKVFLKYYHTEYLSKLYETQVIAGNSN